MLYAEAQLCHARDCGKGALTLARSSLEEARSICERLGERPYYERIVKSLTEIPADTR
jgi:hypothetical protein